ncbi:MAG: hypothetical protein NVS3B26_19710 [Mycobacteriales bacterium]
MPEATHWGAGLLMRWAVLETWEQLYLHDPRVTPWSCTAHGVLQAVSTYDQHEGVVRGDRGGLSSNPSLSFGPSGLEEGFGAL